MGFGRFDWSRIGPPYRPTREVIAQFAEICDVTEPTLLLGVTPEFYDSFPHLTGVEKEKQIIDSVWPGDEQDRSAIHEDWREMDHARYSYGNIIGDLAVTLLGNQYVIKKFHHRCMDWLKPEGIYLQRVMLRRSRVTASDLLEDDGLGWHAFKMKMKHHIAWHTDGPVRWEWILDLFNDTFPDRDALASSRGWTRPQVDTIDFYEGSDVVTCVLTEEQWRYICPDAARVEFIQTEGYEYAEHCPLLMWEKR